MTHAAQATPPVVRDGVETAPAHTASTARRRSRPFKRFRDKDKALADQAFQHGARGKAIGPPPVNLMARSSMQAGPSEGRRAPQDRARSRQGDRQEHLSFQGRRHERR